VAFVVGAVVLTGGIAAAVVLGTNGSGSAGVVRTADVGCVDVAASVGLTFRGDYGATYRVQDAFGDVMQRNMGNGAAVGDYDGDGWLDVLLLGQAGHHSRLFRNDHGHFTDVTDHAGLGGVTSNARVAQFVDLNGSGRPDLVIASDWWPTAPGGAVGGPSQVFRNNGDGTFTDPGYADGLTREGNSMGVATAVGTNGDLQLFITQITDPSGLYGSNIGNTWMTMRQDGSRITWANSAAERGVVDTAWGWGAASVDLNLDGAPDIYAVQGMREFVGDRSPHLAGATSALFLNDGTGTTFQRATGTGCDAAGDQRALVAFDYDRDGAPDLLITQVNGPTLLLRNTIAGRHWLTIAPEGRGDAGINARVSVTAGGRTTTQIVLAGGSYLAGPPREAYVGLGSATTASLVRVAWADGTTTELHDVPADQVLHLPHP
jgi:hypothetical protein